jgi:hypothetical protein
MEITTNLIVSSIGVFLFNIPFGYWRANVRKYTLQWVLAIHIPVPFIIIYRFNSNIGFHWSTYIFFVAAFFLGQLTGGKIYEWRRKMLKSPITSCLFMDVYRCFNHL